MPPIGTVDTDTAGRILDAAERLFYQRGIQAVGIDAVVAEAGVATKTLYSYFGSKDGLVTAYLRRRDRRWMDWLREAAAAAPPGPDRVAAVFDALGTWFADPAFNGCAFINVAGELAASPTARDVAREHKVALRGFLREVAVGCGGGDPESLADWLMLLVEGAIVTAHVEGDSQAALRARAAAAALLQRDLSR
ncbi:MAG TPA: TetR/AcrR family transcriptional regulator [Acidimicrobiales bacterium]|jgi:AcrR family transcriptional regulator|nr:TetR/AcrR family transcriptional regulator [Acidimicrobiales bacterium]